ncbi:SRPBCC family protein [Bdellovibrio bacteriovorus]|uniref:SRPBCC family protein n=1 Tax=Bdellovibrio bacteriovorus TaxID=959 RepID=UPI0021D11A72|nr:SRPBCC family protein [Bdellovibrio bacteriovorus]UXR65941.1 SRPBCC family protein [Bdellovibrio bacteriovorus]
MLLKVVLGILVVLAIFVAFIASRDGHFKYEVSEHINAPIEKVFPYISDLKKGSEWSPFEKVDPNMKKDYQGIPDQVGAKLVFAGNSDAGAGSVEITKIVPNEMVELRLIMTAPMAADNIVTYQVMKDGEGTKFTWSMSGEGGFAGKLVTFFVDCEKMITDQFKQGIANLKTIVEVTN